MKSIIFSLSFLLITFKAWSQYPENRLNIDAGVQLQQPIGSMVNEFGYTLLPNYGSGIGMFLAGTYELPSHILIGGRISSASFSNHTAEPTLLTVNPSSFLLHWSLTGGYNLSLQQWLKIPLAFQTLVEFGLTNHQLSVDGFRLFADRPVNAGNEYNESDLMAGISAQFTYDINLKYKGFIGAGYQFVRADHVLYRDESFQFLSVRMGLTLRLLHNKFYRFER